VDVFEFQGYVSLVVLLAMLAVKGFAFVSSLLFSAEAYTAAGKLTKPAWCAILGLGFAAQLILASSPFGLINLAAVIAAFVYLADVRPALHEMTQHRR
jgi:hypothetical protein